MKALPPIDLSRRREHAGAKDRSIERDVRADAAEDDGTSMGTVHGAATDRGSLLVLDAATLEDVARVQLAVRVPYGFHGNWVPAS